MAVKKYENEAQFTLRLNADILSSVKELAVEDGRSTSKEIETILKEYIKSRKSDK